jgi:hypothetical protein
MTANGPTAQHVFRQRASVALASLCGVVGLLLLLSLVRNWGSYPRPLFAAWVVFGLAVAWSLFVRPAVLLDAGGVTLRNVVRDVQIPWTQLTDVTTRWNLKVFAGDKGYTSWAISSEVERPKAVSAGLFRMPVPGRLSGVAGADVKPPTTVPKTTARSVARSINDAKQEYDEAVTSGGLATEPDARVRVTWAPVAMAVLLLPALIVLVLSLA